MGRSWFAGRGSWVVGEWVVGRWIVGLEWWVGGGRHPNSMSQ